MVYLLAHPHVPLSSALIQALAVCHSPVGQVNFATSSAGICLTAIAQIFNSFHVTSPLIIQSGTSSCHFLRI